MNITINTQAKTVTIESACLKELSKVKKALEAMGENPDEYKISTGNYPYYVYPTFPQITWGQATSLYTVQTEDFNDLGSCDTETRIN